MYQPTNRRRPDNQQDPIRFKKLVKPLESSLLQQLPKHEVRPFLKPFLALADDHDFWNHSLDGLAVLGARGMFRVYKLQRPVAPLAVVADCFPIKPLLGILQSAECYQVLGLNRTGIKLFEGNRDVLDEIELDPGVPQTMSDALGEEWSEPRQTVASYGGVCVGRSPMVQGHGGRKAEVDMEAERLVRSVDHAVLEQHSKPSGLPLILAALPEHHLFHDVSHNSFLIQKSIDLDPDAMSIEELRQRAWQLMEPHHQARMAALVEEFGNAGSEGLGDDDPAQVAKAVVAGRVAKLLIEADREIPGRIHVATGEIELDKLTDSQVDDLLDDLGRLALKMGGQVIIVPTEVMPTKTGITAIYRHSIAVNVIAKVGRPRTANRNLVSATISQWYGSYPFQRIAEIRRHRENGGHSECNK